jgi:class 3 adenylate cyclase
MRRFLVACPMPESAPSPEAAVAAAQQHLERGDPLMAYNDAQEALQRWPDHLRLRQLQALALARSGDTSRANAALGALAASGMDDAETLGMLARTHKDLALAASDAATRHRHLDAAFSIYDKGYRRACAGGDTQGAWYTGINAATLAVLREDLPRARAIAAEVRAICEANRTADSTSSAYWRESTLGEAALILGDARKAVEHYRTAMGLAKGLYGDVSSTRRQAKLLSRHLPDTGVDLIDALRVPGVVAYSGHMIDRPDRRSPRFPASLESSVRIALRARLEALAPFAVYGSAACGTDLLCVEIARELGCETHIVLPFPPAEFKLASVDFAGGGWSARFDDALAKADSVTVTSDHYARGSVATFEYANLVLTGMAALRAATLDAPLHGLAVRDPADTRDVGGTSSIVALWNARGIPVDEIALETVREPGAHPPDEGAERAARHELRAMLFADAVGYSKLSEDQIPGFIDGFLGAVAELSRDTRHRFEHVETSGDGLYMVFRNAADAGQFALELSALTNRFDRARWGLPATFNLRIALHCGPVHCAIDPITGAPLYTGPHTSRAARIEPVTPPGQVYASSAFAAVAAARGDAFAMSYVGRMPLAKGYGSLGLYHLRASSDVA